MNGGEEKKESQSKEMKEEKAEETAGAGTEARTDKNIEEAFDETSEDSGKNARRSKSRKPREKYIGIFHSGIGKATDALYTFLKSSIIGRIFSGGDKFSKKLEESFICRMFGGLRSRVLNNFRKQPKKAYDSDDFGGTVGIFDENTISRSVKVRANQALTSSVILNALNKLIKNIVSLPVLSIGMFMLSFGITTVGVQAIKFLMRQNSSDLFLSLALGILILITSIPALISREESVNECMRCSFIGRFILRSLMGAGEEYEKGKKRSGRISLPMFLAGIVIGALTWFMSPLLLLFILAVAVIAVRTVYMPESGILFLIILLPFISAMPDPAFMCVCASLYISICFFLKVLTGKRSADAVFADFLVLLFALVCIVTSSGTPDGRNAAFMYISFMLMYYVIRNLIRSTVWANRCVGAWVVSSSAASAILIIQVFLGKILEFSLLGSEDAMYWFVSIGIIITVSKFFAAAKYRIIAIAALILQAAALAVCGAWLAITVTCIALLVLLMVCSRKTIAALLLLILALPYVSYFVTKVHLSGFLNIITFSDASQSYRVGVWHASSRMLGDYIFVGTGLGSENFTEIFKGYAPLGTALPQSSMSLLLQILIQLGIVGFIVLALIVLAAAVKTFTLQKARGGDPRHKIYCIGYYSAVLALLIFGIFYDIWSSEVIALSFWMLIGFVPSCAKCEELSNDSNVDFINELSADIHIDCG